MQHIQGEDRNQMFMLSLESVIPPDAFVRVVDTFVDAIDSFKVRAQNSLKNNFNEKKIDRHMAYIDEKIMEYEQDLERNDKEDESQEIKKKIELQELKKANYQTLRDTLEASDEEQISLTDPDARAVVLHRNIVNVGYNIQSSVDAKHMFGTLKRQRGFMHVLVRDKEKVLGEVGLMFIGYNLTQCVSILGVQKLIKLLKECCLPVFRLRKWLLLGLYNKFLFSNLKIAD